MSKPATDTPPFHADAGLALAATLACQPPAIEMRDLALGHGGHAVVCHLSMTVAPGTMLAVVGPNGAGKSTLIRALAGRLKPTGGALRGLSGHRVACLPQHNGMDRNFPITVQEMVMLGLWHRVGALGRFTASHRWACHEALETVGLHGLEHRSIDTLSGGQMQRARFARLILQDAPIILLDEPFAAVDQRTTEDLLTLLHRWHAQGRTVITVLHDLAQVRAHFPQTLLLAREPVAHGATPQVLTEAHWLQALRMREPFDAASPSTHAAPAQPHTREAIA
jgi:zinc/manganese transport system ATP-binding protein